MFNPPSYSSKVGEKIRKYRLFRKMTQKQLAELCGLSESAIRNYELGNRIPDDSTIRDISDALEIDSALLRDIDPNDITSMEYLFMELENIYGLVPRFIDGELHLIFEKPSENASNIDIINHYFLEDMLLDWCAARDAFLNGQLSLEEYETWKIAHSDIIGIDTEIKPYRLSPEEEILVESCRRAEGLRPIPLKDSDGNPYDIPKRKKGKSISKQEPDTSLSQNKKRKRKPKTK